MRFVLEDRREPEFCFANVILSLLLYLEKKKKRLFGKGLQGHLSVAQDTADMCSDTVNLSMFELSSHIWINIWNIGHQSRWSHQLVFFQCPCCESNNIELGRNFPTSGMKFNILASHSDTFTVWPLDGPPYIYPCRLSEHCMSSVFTPWICFNLFGLLFLLSMSLLYII